MYKTAAKDIASAKASANVRLFYGITNSFYSNFMWSRAFELWGYSI